MLADEPFAESVRRGHELRDISVRGVFWFVVWLVIAAAVIHVVVGWLYLEFRPPPTMAFPAEEPVVNWENVPEPHLETKPERR